jgi:predicted O-methyltransferase YrrM
MLKLHKMHFTTPPPLIMIKFTNQICKVLLPKSYYERIKKFYYSLLSANYDLSKDLEYNENLFKKLNFDIDKIKHKLNSLNLSYHDDWLSWHYHLFVGLKDYFKDEKINILEIGTSSGGFSNFISKVYDDHQITTINLDESEIPLSEFGGDEENKREFLEKRNNNLNRKNINFVELNSINLKKYFYEKKFDLIWVDGDHLNPQVTIDIVNSLDLLNNDGIICTDDVIMDIKFEKNKYVSNEGFLTLKYLDDNKILKNEYLIKRISKTNSITKKYVSISTFENNSKFIVN